LVGDEFQSSTASAELETMGSCVLPLAEGRYCRPFSGG
jgi:hypothetical protein